MQESKNEISRITEDIEIKGEKDQLQIRREIEEIKTALEDFNNEVMVLSNIDNGLFSVPETIESIYDLIPSDGITITSIKFNDEELYMEIIGVSSTRDKLLELQRNAEASEIVNEAAIPLSSYDKKTKIPFQLNIYLNFTALPPYGTSATL